MYQPSEFILNKIKHIEGFRESKYLDPPGNTRGLYSIGYGHQIQPSEKYLLTAKLTPEQADAIFMKDIAWRIADINNHLTRPITQAQGDALLNQHYNYPKGALAVINTWNATGSVADTAARFHDFVHADGKVNSDLVARANYNAGLFSGGVLEALDQKKN